MNSHDDIINMVATEAAERIAANDDLSKPPPQAEPPAGAAGVPCPTCHGGGKIRSHPRTYGGGRRCPDCNGSGTIATPSPQPQGGTPEVDAAEQKLLRWIERNKDAVMRGSHLDSDDPRPDDGWTVARTLERQRNEARAALAAAESDKAVYWGQLQESREALAAAQAEVEEGKLRLQEREDVYDRLSQEMVKQSAELEQTRRERDNWKSSAEVSAHERKIACERLAAAEQRAEGERQLRETACKDWAEDDATLKAIAKKHGIDTEGSSFGVPTMVDCIEEMERTLTAQRDTAIRERDEAKARLQRANDLGCLLVMNGKWTEAEWAEHQNITGTAPAALAAKTTEGGDRL